MQRALYPGKKPFVEKKKITLREFLTEVCHHHPFVVEYELAEVWPTIREQEARSISEWRCVAWGHLDGCERFEKWWAFATWAQKTVQRLALDDESDDDTDC
jgi:hypothetical protein